jgi:hypothetical protein
MNSLQIENVYFRFWPVGSGHHRVFRQPSALHGEGFRGPDENSMALGTIRGARVLPAVADQLRASARIGTVHYSNLIEGNQLSVLEAERAARGQLRTDEIERELRLFLAERSEWPTPKEFRAAGKGPLYAAAARAGGIGRWRAMVGL